MSRKVYFCCLLTIVFCACSSSTDNDISLAEASIDRQVELSKNDKSPHCEVKLKLSYVKNSGNKADVVAKTINETITKRLFDMSGLTMQQAVDSFANNYTKDYVKNCLPLYREDSNDPQKSAWYEYRYSITTDTKQERDHTLTYMATLDYYEGGAHGINQLLVMNFDTESGQLITLSDIFVPGYDKRLNELLLNALMEETGTTTIEQLHDMGYLFATNIFAPENFILSSDAITFIYNPYEIAPYAMGTTKLTVDNSELKDILK